MAKKKIDYDKIASGLFIRTEQYADKVRRHYASAIDELLKLTATGDLGESGAFSFGDNTKLSEKANSILRGLYSAVYNEIKNGVEAEWGYANASCDALIESIFGKSLKESGHFARWFSRNQDAMDSFFSRKSAYGGLNLSQRVWKYTGDLKTEMEMALTLSLGQGDSAASVSRQVRKYLQEPDMMFRRFRVKTGEREIYDEEGNVIGKEPIYGRKWKRKVIDPQTGETRWENFNPRNYHPGQGVYRSSYKNAMRLTRSETNMAYRTAEQTRWQKLDFVIGYEIKLSNNHPRPDICNDLKGEYPKDFVFKGWHPQCRCYCVPILASQEEFINMENDILEGDEPTQPSGIIRRPPKQFYDWWDENKERTESAQSIPYWVLDNQDYINKKRKVRVKTPKERDEIIKRWEARAREHQNILNMADRVSTVAKYYPEIDITKLQEYISSKQITQAKQEARDVAQQVLAIKKDEKYLSQLIPDVHGWKSQFTSAELHQVYDAVDRTLTNIASKPLDEQLKALTKEITYVADPNYLKPHTLYPTWQVAQSAYAKQIARVQDAIDWKQIGDVLSEAKTFKTKSQPYLDLISQLEGAVAANDKSKAKLIVSDMQAKREALKKAADARERKKSIGKALKLDRTKISDTSAIRVGEVMVNSPEVDWDADLLKELEDAVKAKDATKVRSTISKLGVDLDDSYSKYRRDAARWHHTASDADDYFHDNAVSFWKKVDDAEKAALDGYTGGSAYITEPLRAIKGHYYSAPWKHSDAQIDKHIRAMTRALDKQDLIDDVWIKRDDASWQVEYAFGISDLSAFRSNPSALVGRIGVDESFMSCGSCKETRFTATCRKDVIYNLYCPAGTKGAYAEPWSACGKYGKSWDGAKKANPGKYSENEVILQRGVKMRITKAEYDAAKDQWYIDVEVLEQMPKDFELVSTPSGTYCKFK